jgi:hypothetical protein
MLAFVHIQKTAGTTFTTLLRRHFGLRHFDRPGFRERALRAEDLRHIRRIYPGLRSIAGHPVRPWSTLHLADPDIRFYSFLRDPVARSLSHIPWFLRWKAHDGVFYDDFDALVRDWCATPDNRDRHCFHLSAQHSADAAREVIARHPFLLLRVSHFDESLLLFRHWAGEASMDLRYHRVNTASDPYERLQESHPAYLSRIREFEKRLRVDESLLQLIREANQEDTKLLKWAESDIWPQQVANYPGDLPADTARFREVNQNSPPSVNREPALPRLYRNTVFKTFRPLLLPSGETEDVVNSPWL